MIRPLLQRLVFVLGAPAAVAVTVAGIEACGGDEASGPTCARPAPADARTPSCRTGNDCGENVGVPGGVYCTAEGFPPGSAGGIAPPPYPCATDSECVKAPGSGGAAGTAYVCEGGSCRAPCTADAACSTHQRCIVATGHCEARPCAAADPACPDNTFCSSQATCAPKLCDPGAATGCALGSTCDPSIFACKPRPCSDDAGCPDTFRCEGGACARKTCACDTECGAAGYCLKGTCAEALGTCAGVPIPGRPLLLASVAIVAPLVANDAWG